MVGDRVIFGGAMSAKELFRFSSERWLGRSVLTFEVKVFDEYFLYSQTNGLYPSVSDIPIPIRSLQKIIWDSREKVSMEWVGDGQFRQYMLFAKTADLERFVAYLSAHNPALVIDATNQDKELSFDRDRRAITIVCALGLALVATVIWGARYLGLIPY